MSEIQCNDKVKNQYEVFIATKAEEQDMRAVANEYIKFGYKKIVDTTNNDDIILIYSKDAV